MDKDMNTGSKCLGNIVASQSFQRHTIGHLKKDPGQHRRLQNICYAVTPIVLLLFILSSCSVQRQISKQATALLLKDTAINTGHIGISIYEPATGRYWYNYEATKYFVPASNTKLFSLYAGLKYLGDSLPALRYEPDDDSGIRIQAAGDPTFLLEEYPEQVAYHFLKQYKKITWVNPTFTDHFMGRGWAWDDYTATYMAQRSNFPIYGNLIQLKKTGNQLNVIPASLAFVIPAQTDLSNGFDVQKNWDANLLTIIPGNNQQLSIPFTPNITDLLAMLRDTLHATIEHEPAGSRRLKNLLRSRPVDSMYRPMMHRSDNFFAEQTLLMASNELLGFMDDGKMIDRILDTDLKDIPQRPKWVDGSGLSRYNLFTPQSFVYLLNKMKDDYGLQRLKNILPTGGTGTLAAYYKKDAGFIFAKTGTLSNHCALSGFIITKKNKLLIFSVLANHYQTTATPVRRAVEKFLTGLREKY